MEIKVTAISATLNSEREYVAPDDYHIKNTVRGDIGIRLTGKYNNGKYYNVSDMISIHDLSNETQKKFVDLFREVEEELKGK